MELITILVIAITLLQVQGNSLKKREAFGMWELDPMGTFDSDEPLNIAQKAVVEVETVAAIIANETAEIIGDIAHPLRTRMGRALIVFGLLTLAIILIFHCWTLLIWIWNFLVRCYTVLTRCTACFYCCALSPFIRVRNAYKRMKDRRAFEASGRKAKIYQNLEPMEMIRKSYSPLHMDEYGYYLEADNSHRVYLMKNNYTEDLLQIQLATTRNNVVPSAPAKESIIATSRLYKTDKVPDFQGQFMVDDILIGHYSRIRYAGKDCIITAYHVLDYNRISAINICKGDKRIVFSSFKSNIVACSHSDQLDFIIMELPPHIFSMLGLKVGKWTNRVQAREPVAINQLFEGKPCVSTATVRLHKAKAWHIEYGASTTAGTSGAPVLDTRNNIIGIHLEYDSNTKSNVGVVPPVFRNVKKESPTNEDLLQAQIDREELDTERFLREVELPEFIVAEFREHTNMDWAAEMDAFEDAILAERLESEDTRELDRLYAARQDLLERAQFSSFGKKRGPQRNFKESPWTCSQCYCIQEKGFDCVKCGYALKRLMKKDLSKIEDAKNIMLQSSLPVVVKDQMEKFLDADFVKATISLEVEKAMKRLEDMMKAKHDDWQSKADMQKRVDEMAESIGKAQKLYPKLAEAEVLVEKKLAQIMNTDWSLLNCQNGSLNKKVEVFNEKESDRTGGVSLEKKDVPVVTVKTVKRKRNRNKKKETVAVENSAVPLNSQTPEKSGGITTNGVSQKASQTNLQSSVEVKSSSTEEDKKRKTSIGVKPKKSTPAVKTTDGQREEQKPKPSVSNSNVTNTKSKDANPQLKK
jgi:hypothetical protein